jgi:hypothetical protein
MLVTFSLTAPVWTARVPGRLTQPLVIIVDMLTVSPPARTRESSGSSAVDLLSYLRGDASRRPRVDPGLAGGLREWLEDGVAEAAASLPAGIPAIVIDRRALSVRPHLHVGEESKAVTLQLARGALVGVLFRQFITTGRIDDPIADALAALEIDERSTAIVDFLRCLPGPTRVVLHREVVAHAAILMSRWPAVARGWFPRTRDRISIPLAGGRIVLAGTIDLLLGAPSDGQASVCLVDVRSGERRSEHRAELHFHGLLETLRSGAAPFRLASYYTGSGEIDAEDVPDTLLTAAVRRTLDVVVRVLDAGSAG